MQHLEDQRKRGGLGSGDSEVIEVLGSLEAREALDAEVVDSYYQELLEEAMTQVRLRVSEQTWDAFCRLALQQQSAAEAAAALGMKTTAVWMARSRVQQLLRQQVQQLEAADQE